ncbi:serine hydrolase domain-containing protein [Anaerolentibacter hominis]|uniref:serine hydrolase domain-containing protein n=1 Tax=Anaerolentibacter hominis TaxID=3079009 RepID=UPI0031B81CC8
MAFKKLKKSLCLLLAGIMVLGSSATAGAAETKDNFKSFDFNSGIPVQSSEIPKITEEETERFLESYKADGLKAYADETAKGKAKTKADMLTGLYGVTSVQYAVIKDGKMQFSGQSGYTDRAAKKAPTKNTMYGIGSISKIFTTTAVLQLAEEGKVDLDTPVVNYVPKFKMADARYKDITVRMLLNHSSGLLGSTLANGMLFKDGDTINHDTFLKQLSTQILKADPGAFSVYCNDGFTLAEILVETVTGKTFSDYIRENICEPLGMDRTATPADIKSWSYLAGIYSDEKSTKALPPEALNIIGAGGIYSTAADLCQLATLYMKNGEQFLSKESAKASMNEEFARGIWLKDQQGFFSYGLGWDSVCTFPFEDYGMQALSKGGDSVYYHGELIVIPEENLAVAVLSSGGSSSLDQLFGQSVLLDYMKEKGQIEELKDTSRILSTDKASMPKELENYSGVYASTMGINAVQIKDGVLTLASVFATDPSEVITCTYNKDGVFVDSTGANFLSFEKEENGETYLTSGSYVVVPQIGDTFMYQYQGQKIEENPISESVEKAWMNRTGKRYFVLSEKYSSINYLASGVLAGVNYYPALKGYLGTMKIVDENNATAFLQVPIMGGRDLSTVHFYKKDGKEYFTTNGMTVVEEAGIGTLSIKSGSKVTIGSDGYAKWYKIGSKAAGKTLKVTCPKKGAFAVYDSNGVCLNHSYVSGKTSVKLPKGGYVVFAADKNQKFTLKY